MNIGHLENEDFVKAYKKFGFKTRNHLIDAACALLKKELLKEKRAQWRQAAHKDYAKSNVEHVWESLDGEDFQNA